MNMMFIDNRYDDCYEQYIKLEKILQSSFREEK